MNILILGYNFYGYEKEILTELKSKHTVKYINLQISFLENVYLYIIKKIFGIEKAEKEISKILNKKIERGSKKERKKIDILFILSYYLPLKDENLEFLEKKFEIKEKWLYLWDDISRLKDFQKYIKKFNKVYSFDKKDCIENNLIYRPTFYSKRLEKLKNNKIIYDVSFIGAYSPERNYLLNNLIKKVFKNNFIYLYLYISLYIKKYIFMPNYKLKDINFFKISKERYNTILSQSEIVIDLLQFNQTGVTQRTLDALYLNKKIITNNEYIKNYDFYNTNNILIINKNTSSNEIEEFRKKEYIKIDKKIIDYYSVERWIKDIFE